MPYEKNPVVLQYGPRRYRRAQGKGLVNNYSKAADRASEDDARWFANRHGRRYRLRRYIRGEGGPLERRTGPRPSQTIVRQVAPGVRLRVPIRLRGRAALSAEAIAEHLWHMAAAEIVLKDGTSLIELAEDLAAKGPKH